MRFLDRSGTLVGGLIAGLLGCVAFGQNPVVLWEHLLHSEVSREESRVINKMGKGFGIVTVLEKRRHLTQISAIVAWAPATTLLVGASGPAAPPGKLRRAVRKCLQKRALKAKLLDLQEAVRATGAFSLWLPDEYPETAAFRAGLLGCLEGKSPGFSQISVRFPVSRKLTDWGEK